MYNTTGIILSGGKSNRMGKNKSLLSFPNKPLIEILINKLVALFNELIIVTNKPSPYVQELGKPTFYSKYEIKVVEDVFPDCGPLGGIYTGLLTSQNKYSFIAACDMPFLNVELIKSMINNVAGWDIIIPRLNNRALPNKGYETLHAIYSKTCMEYIEKQLKQNNLKIIDFFPQVKIKEITEDIIKQFDPRLLSFFNINSDADYQQALNIAPSLRT